MRDSCHRYSLLVMDYEQRLCLRPLMWAMDFDFKEENFYEEGNFRDSINIAV